MYKGESIRCEGCFTCLDKDLKVKECNFCKTKEEVDRHKVMDAKEYLSRAKWDVISKDMGLDKRWLIKLHYRALKEVEAILKIDD